MSDQSDMSHVERRLHTERNLWLATTRADGRPHVTPVWFVYLRNRFWIGTGAGAVKTRNVIARPEVSLALEDGDTPVVAEGLAIVHETARPDDVVAAFADKFEWDITIPDDEDVGTVVLLEVDVSRWLMGGPKAS